MLTEYSFLEWFLWGYAVVNFLIMLPQIYHPRSNGERRPEPLDGVLLFILYAILVGATLLILMSVSYLTGSIIPLLIALGLQYHVSAFLASSICDLCTGRQIFMPSGLGPRAENPQVTALQAQVANQEAQIRNLNTALSARGRPSHNHGWPIQYRLDEPEKSDHNPRESAQRRIIRRETNDNEV